MARRETRITIATPDRDHGKIFVVMEMPAAKFTDWATRAMLALGNSGVEISEDQLSGGAAGFASIALTLLGRVKFELWKPLANDLMACVKIQPSPDRTDVVRAMIPDDIEEFTTPLVLQKEALALHINFSEAGGLLSWLAAAKDQGVFKIT